MCAAIVAIAAGICWLVTVLKKNECKMYGICSIITLVLASLAMSFKLLHYIGGSFMIMICTILIPIMVIWTACYGIKNLKK